MYQFPVKGIVSPLVILHVVPDAPTGLLHTILSMVGNPPDVGMVVGLLGSQLLHTPLPEDPTPWHKYVLYNVMLHILFLNLQ